MKKIFKRASAAVIALAVMLTAVVFDAPQNLVAAARGDDYELDRNGNLTIYSDTGMTDWKENGFMDADDVQTVEMGSSVTSIPEGAFGFCQNLTSVEIGSGVQTIDADAFSNCSSLTEITVASGNTTYSSEGGVLFNTDKTQLIRCPGGKQGSYEIPSTVTSIEQSAFEDCRQLTSVTAATGSRLTTIKDYAFRNCSTLASITIPEGVTSLGIQAFNSCGFRVITIPASLTSMSIDESNGSPFINCSNLTAINVVADNTAYSSANGVLFNKNKTKLICCPEGTADGYEIPNTVTSVGTWAFYACKKFVSVTIPDTVTSIGDKAFSYCTKLTSVTIPDTVTSIGDEMFSNCYELASVTIPNSVTSIGNKAFYSCWKQLTSVTIPKSVNSIGDEAFSSCSNLTTVTFKKVTPPTIGNNIFYQYTNKLEKIMVPARSVDTYKAVSNLEPYKEKIVEGEADNPCGDNAAWEYDETTKTLTISGTGAMTDWSTMNDVPWTEKKEDIENVVIADGITSVGGFAFKNFTNLESVTIPDAVTQIGVQAFEDCTSLKTVTFKGKTPPTIGSCVFNNCNNLEKIVVPENSVDAYKNVENLAYLGNLEYLKEIITADTGSTPSGEGWTFDEDTGKLTITGGDTSAWRGSDLSKDKIKSVEIKSGVTAISLSSFDSCSNLTSVTIPDTVTDIGANAFVGCTSLTSITIPESVTSIDMNAFNGCTKLETVTFEGENPPTIGSDAFGGCDKLETIEVPEGSEDDYKEKFDGTGMENKIPSGSGDNTGGDNTGGGNTGGGNTGGGNTGGGNTGGGNTGGDNTGGDNTGGDNTSGGNTSGGNTSGDNTSGGNTSGGNTSSGNINTENTSKDVQLGENVPKAEIAAPTDELISAVLDPEELAQLKDTDKVSIVLEIVENVPAEDKQSVGSYLESGSHVLAQYMDIALYKVINDSKTQITSTNKPIRITFEVPEGLRAADRTFAVLRVHNGETVLLPDLDNDANTVTIETDRFSTYALVYRDNAPAADGNNPSTGIAVSLIPLVAAAAILTVAVKLKKK